MIDLRQLQVFFAVARHRNFAAAARELGLSGAAVTRDIAKLEASLGAQLFVRTTRTVTLTTEGAAMAETLRPALAALEQALSGAGGPEAGLHGQIKLSVPLSLGMRILPDVVASFRARYPGISVYLSLDDTLIDIVAQGYDLAIRISEAPTDKSTIWRKLCAVPRVLVAAPGAAERAVEAPEAIAEDRRLSYGGVDHREVWRLSRGGAAQKLVTGARIGANNGEVLARMAEAGEGVALLPRFIVAEALAEGRLVEVLAGWQAPTLWLTLYYPPYDRLPPVVATFSEFVERELLALDVLGAAAA